VIHLKLNIQLGSNYFFIVEGVAVLRKYTLVAQNTSSSRMWTTVWEHHFVWFIVVLYA